MTEDFDNHRRIIDGGDNLQGTAAVGTVFHVDVEGIPTTRQLRMLPTFKKPTSDFCHQHR
jgi:hypothetical protein